MWCCGADDLKNNGKYRKSVFDKRQIDSLKRKFNHVSGNEKYIDRETFKKNIGYLGIRAVTSFLDRIFNSFDIDEDNKISLDDFIDYMQILKDGTDDQKAQISFNLIYMQKNSRFLNRQRKSSLGKNNAQNTSQQRNQTKKKKAIDMTMFQQFFEDFYKSWSSITNESIPKQTKTSLKQFIRELFVKVQADGYKNIDLEYYKKLYKDRDFMMAFRQINSKLGNFFIKTTNNQYQKNIALFHKTLTKIMNLSQRVFPLQNRAFIDDMDKPKFKSTLESPSYAKNQQQIQDFFDQNIDKYFYDAKRYQYENIFETKQEDKYITKNQTRTNTRIIPNENFTKAQSSFTILKEQSQNQSKFPSEQIQTTYNRTSYQSKLQDHVAFLQKKLLFVQNAFKQILDETKQIYNEMHQEFIKIFQRIKKQQNEKETQLRQYGQDRVNMRGGQSPGFSDKDDSQKNKKSLSKGKRRKDDKKVFFGHKNFNLVLQIMVGIQMSVRSVSGFQQIIFEEPQDFNLKHTFEMDYGHFGQNDVLYTFTDYAPNVFNHIRKIYGIGTEDYISSIGPNQMMSALIMGKMASFEQLVSEGKSGSFFYHTEDGKYLIKTISQREFNLMRKILEGYFKHLRTNSQTLMPRIFGLHKITETIKNNIKYDDHLTYYLIVMNNFFNTKDKFIDRYDLKGSWIGRQNTAGHGVKKDLNFIKDKKTIDIDLKKKKELYEIIKKDAEFFAENSIIDYSLLLGFVQSNQQKRASRLPRKYSLSDIGNDHLQQQQAKKGSNIVQEKQLMNFKFRSDSKNTQSYLFGIIDILTEYNSIKKAEYLFKGCMYDSKGISAIPPQDYKNRFLEFLKFQVLKINNLGQTPKKLSVLMNSRSKSKSLTQKREPENIPLLRKIPTKKETEKEDQMPRDQSLIRTFDVYQMRKRFN